MAIDKIQVEGLGKLNRELREIGGAEARRAIAAAQREAAQIVYKEALPHVPVGSNSGEPGKRSKHPGRLRKSLRVTARPSGATVSVGGRRVPYGAAIHWGYPSRNIEGRPFIYNALGKKREAVRLKFLEELDKVLDRFQLNRDNV